MLVTEHSNGDFPHSFRPYTVLTLTTSARMTLRLFRSTLCFAVFELRLLYTCGTRVEIVTDIIRSCALDMKILIALLGKLIKKGSRQAFSGWFCTVLLNCSTIWMW